LYNGGRLLRLEFESHSLNRSFEPHDSAGLKTGYPLPADIRQKSAKVSEIFTMMLQISQ
jgi:hypothetical protein